MILIVRGLQRPNFGRKEIRIARGLKWPNFGCEELV